MLLLFLSPVVTFPFAMMQKTFLTTPVGDSIKEKELVSLKQLFLFNVPSLSLRFTPKK